MNENENYTYTVYQRPTVADKPKPAGRLKLRIAALCSASLILGAAAGLSFSSFANDSSNTEVSYSVAPSYSAAIANTASALSVSDIYAQNVDGVVSISTESTARNIFGQITRYASSGTGFIISEDGYILTCYHVVEDASIITVTTYSGENYSAKLIGYESDNDIAVLKIDAQNLKYLSISKDELTVGESVYAIGNPLGEYTFTLTSGILSALDREINIDGTPINMFQIDAAVSSGNSGGPVLNAKGEVIGIVSAKTKLTGVEGLGFAIPINDVAAMVNDIIENGYVGGKAYLGVTTANAVNRYGQLVSGAYVQYVESGSCAAKAGIQTADLITAVDNNAVTSSASLTKIIKKYKAGDSAKITFSRNGKSQSVTVTFDEQTNTAISTNGYSAWNSY